jgi:hypothetical protein
MGTVDQLPNTLAGLQHTITAEASSFYNTVITFSKNEILPILKNIWSVVRDIFSSFCHIVKSNPKTTVLIIATVLVAAAISVAFLLLKKEKDTPNSPRRV